jgi:uncharacterized small protein (DUF1192 family)
MTQRWLIATTSVLLATGAWIASLAQSDRPSGPRQGDPPAQATTGDDGQTQPSLQDKLARQFLERLAEEEPEEYARLMELRKRRPGIYKLELLAAWVRRQRMEQTPKEVRQAKETIETGRRVIFRLVMEYRRESDSQRREAVRQKIVQAVGELVDADITLREYKVKELEERLAAIRQEIKDRRANRDEVVEDRVQRVLELAERAGPMRRRGREGLGPSGRRRWGPRRGEGRESTGRD